MKGNKLSDVVKEYARRLSDDDLNFLTAKLGQRIGSDLAEAIEVFQKNSDLDYWLSKSTNANELYDMIDTTDDALQKECERRFAPRS